MTQTYLNTLARIHRTTVVNILAGGANLSASEWRNIRNLWNHDTTNA